MNFLLLKAKDGSEHVDVLTMCCVIKALAGWHLTETAAICRERCGGQGYLSCNRFGTAIALSHAAITAEGDNSVLMQKVATERLAMLDPAAVQKAAAQKTNDSGDLFDQKYVHQLLEIRESKLFLELGMKMMKAGKKGRFETWMYKEQDLVQAAAHAYGDQLISQCFSDVLKNADPSVQPILNNLYSLYQVHLLQQDLGNFITSGLLPVEKASKVNEAAASLCHDVSPQALALCDAFAISDKMLNAPIAADWIKYNEVDNQGEVTNTQM